MLKIGVAVKVAQARGVAQAQALHAGGVGNALIDRLAAIELLDEAFVGGVAAIAEPVAKRFPHLKADRVECRQLVAGGGGLVRPVAVLPGKVVVCLPPSVGVVLLLEQAVDFGLAKALEIVVDARGGIGIRPPEKRRRVDGVAQLQRVDVALKAGCN